MPRVVSACGMCCNALNIHEPPRSAWDFRASLQELRKANQELRAHMSNQEERLAEHEAQLNRLVGVLFFCMKVGLTSGCPIFY